VSSDSNLVVVDWITSGRHESGEKWDFDLYRSTNNIFLDDGQPLFLDTVIVFLFFAMFVTNCTCKLLELKRCILSQNILFSILTLFSLLCDFFFGFLALTDVTRERRIWPCKGTHA
jgi:hypothetical protein